VEWTARGSNPGEYNRFFTAANMPDRPWDPPSVTFSVYRGVKWPERVAKKQHSYSTDIKNSGAIPLRLLYAFVAGTGKNLNFIQQTHYFRVGLYVLELLYFWVLWQVIEILIKKNN
jgi:hypothetical protein